MLYLLKSSISVAKKWDSRYLRIRHFILYEVVMPKSSQSDLFPARLQAAREKRKLSQEDLAKRAGLQASAISHFETGSRKPSFDNLRRLADALKVTTDYLLGRVTDIEALAGADKLFRDLDRLTADDRDFAEMFIKALADKARKKRDE
ncbi:MAG: helix-turn-helix domain-containing protein [Nitrospira sp.]|nr:helix-turn-helix domain-containing protein [Nitrospira sp.]